MSWFGGKKPDAKQQLKEAKSEFRHGKRDIDREVRQLDLAEQRCQDQIKKYAREGNQPGMRIMAKELVNLRKQRERMQGQSAVMNSLQTKTAVMASMGTMATAMGSAAKVLETTNAHMQKTDVVGTMRKFAEVSDRMAVTDEMLDDMMSAVFDEDTDAADDIVTEALSELNIGLSGQMPSAPLSVPTLGTGVPTTTVPTSVPTRVPVRAGGGPSDEDAQLAAVLREVLRK